MFRLFRDFTGAYLLRRGDAERLIPLVQLAAQCLPFSTLKEDAQTWLVLCRGDR